MPIRRQLLAIQGRKLHQSIKSGRNREDQGDPLTAVRILHISDTHFPAYPLPSHLRICQALIEKVSELRSEREFNLIAFTGDVTFSGATQEFSTAREMLIEPLMAACGITANEFLVVPGNHDVDRTLIDPYAEVGMRERLNTDPREIESLLANYGALQNALSRMQGFNDFYQGLFGAGDQDDRSALHRFRGFELMGISVDVFLLNTAWRSSGEQDRGNLWLSAEDIEGLASRSLAQLRIGLQHHPTEWLSDTDQRECSPILRRTLTLHLTGHSHYRDSFKLTSSIGSTVHVKGGCLYESSHFENVFAVIDVEIEDRPHEVKVQSYKYDTQLGFVELSESDSNTFTLSDEESGRWMSTHHVIVPDMWRRLKELAIEKSITPRLMSETQSGRVSEIFTQPELLKLPFGEVIARIEEGHSGVGEFELSTEALVDSLRRGVPIGLSGSADSGVTGTILLLLDASCDSIERPAVYVSCKNLTSGPRGVEGIIRKELNELGFGISVRDEVGKCTVGIDDVEQLGSRQIENVVEWVKTHPECHVVFGWHDESGRVAGILEKTFGESAQFAHLGPMGADSAKAMVAAWSPSADSTLGDRVFGLIKKEALPRNPFVLSLICYLVIEEVAGDDVENETIVLDRYVLHLLERASSGVSSRTHLDLDNWSKLLETLALEYRRRNVRFIARREVDRVMIDVYDRLGWSGSPLRIVDQLVAWNVLREKDDEVGFWHPAICDLFLGRNLASEFTLGTSDKTESYASVALSEPLMHFHPIRHCAQLTRGNIELLQRIGELANSDPGLSRAARDHSEDKPVLDFSGLTRGDLNDSDTGPEVEREPDVASPGAEENQSSAGEWKQYLTEQDRQQGLTSFDAPELVSRSMTVLRTVSLVSIVVRSSERIEDQKLKRDVVKSALLLWSVAFDELREDVVLSSGLDNAISRAIQKRSGGENADGRESERRRKGLNRLLLGLVVMSGVISDLSSSKLAKALREVLESGEIKSDVLATTLGAIALAEGLRAHDTTWLSELRKTYLQVGKKPISRELIFAYLMYVISDTGSGVDVYDDVLAFLADLVLDAGGRTGPARRSTEKTRVMETLRQRLSAQLS